MSSSQAARANGLPRVLISPAASGSLAGNGKQGVPAGLITEPGRGAHFRLGGFFFPILRWRVRFEGMNQATRSRSYLLDRSLERGLVCFRWFVKTADFSHKLERGILNLFGSDRWIKVEKCSDVPAHSRDLG
jgi:hypothetical protein